MNRLLAVMALLFFSNANAIDVYSNYEERLGETPQLASLEGDAAFGAKFDAATGAGAFYVPVLTIPGNNGLDISVVYKLGVENVAGHTEWYFEQDEPYVGGTFSEERGWVTYGGSASRCSETGAWYRPPPVAPTNGRNGWFQPSEYWSGYHLSLPGGGGETLNRTASDSAVPAPSSGGPFYWSTNALWFFSCIPLIAGGGEGYLAHSPDGLKYHFNTLRSSYLPELNKFDYSGKDLDLYRQEVRIYAGKIEDRFGNFVSGLTASDGRAITKTVSGNIVTFKHKERQWSVNTAPPYTVTYPDGSQWKATVAGTIHDLVMDSKGSCPIAGGATSNSTTSATILTPSGATATYVFKPIPIGYSYVEPMCVPQDDSSVANLTPSWLIRTSLVKRSISGPGLSTSSLNIDYGATNNCYTNRAPKCVANSPTNRVITHHHSGGTYKRFTYGNRSGVDADLLLKIEEGQWPAPPLRTTEYDYALLPSVGNYVVPDYTTFFYFPSSTNRVVMVNRTTKQGGVIFEWKVPSSCGPSGTALCIDALARPTKVMKLSRLGS